MRECSRSPRCWAQLIGEVRFILLPPTRLGTATFLTPRCKVLKSCVKIAKVMSIGAVVRGRRPNAICKYGHPSLCSPMHLPCGHGPDKSECGAQVPEFDLVASRSPCAYPGVILARSTETRAIRKPNPTQQQLKQRAVCVYGTLISFSEASQKSTSEYYNDMEHVNAWRPYPLGAETVVLPSQLLRVANHPSL